MCESFAHTEYSTFTVDDEWIYSILLEIHLRKRPIAVLSSNQLFAVWHNSISMTFQSNFFIINACWYCPMQMMEYKVILRSKWDLRFHLQYNSGAMAMSKWENEKSPMLRTQLAIVQLKLRLAKENSEKITKAQFT